MNLQSIMVWPSNFELSITGFCVAMGVYLGYRLTKTVLDFVFGEVSKTGFAESATSTRNKIYKILLNN